MQWSSAAPCTRPARYDDGCHLASPHRTAPCLASAHRTHRTSPHLASPQPSPSPRQSLLTRKGPGVLVPLVVAHALSALLWRGEAKWRIPLRYQLAAWAVGFAVGCGLQLGSLQATLGASAVSGEL